MAASAGAARAGEATTRSTAFSLVVLGGLVEGTALGVAQSTALRSRLDGRRTAWTIATVLVAGLGWAAGAAPSTLADPDGSPPALRLVLVGALGIGLVAGPALGVAQALVWRGLVRHPWRWVAANTVAWSVAMPVIFVGASTAGAGWPWWVVVGYAAATGLVAGAALGVLTGAWLPALDGPPLRHRAVLAGARVGAGPLVVVTPAPRPPLAPGDQGPFEVGPEAVAGDR